MRIENIAKEREKNVHTQHVKNKLTQFIKYILNLMKG